MNQTTSRLFRMAGFLIFILLLNTLSTGCYTYRLATDAQEGSEALDPVVANSYFWGLLNKPVQISTPDCDALKAKGVSIVSIKTNLGYALITVATLGIWCPVKVQWQCSKPCTPSGEL